MNLILERTLSVINELEDLDRCWEDLDRYWHLPSVEGLAAAEDLSPKETRLNHRQRTRRSQRAAAAVVTCGMVR